MRLEELKRLNIDDYIDIEPCGRSMMEIMEFADEFNECYMQDKELDIKRIIEQNKEINGRVHYVSTQEILLSKNNVYDYLMFIHDNFDVNESDFDIILPEDFRIKDNSESFLILAKCLGHYFLHSPLLKSRVSISDNGKTDEEAEWFALTILMPTKEFMQNWIISNNTIALAALYELDKEFIKKRLKMVNLKEDING
jgi:hypothetical protein